MQVIPRRHSTWQWLIIGALATGIAFFGSRALLSWPAAGLASAAESSPRAFAPRSAGAPPPSTFQRQREGTPLTDVPGHFKLTGDRATFFPARSDAHYMVLENLNLERIATAISDIPEQIPWVVSGTLTEYRGANYLLVTKAILQNAPANPNRAAGSADPSSVTRLGQGF